MDIKTTLLSFLAERDVFESCHGDELAVRHVMVDAYIKARGEAFATDYYLLVESFLKSKDARDVWFQYLKTFTRVRAPLSQPVLDQQITQCQAEFLKNSPISSMGSSSTLRDPTDGYAGHDLKQADMSNVYSIGRTPHEAVENFCKARILSFDYLGAILSCEGSKYTWGYYFTAEGTSCKAAGIFIPGGALMTWWK